MAEETGGLSVQQRTQRALRLEHQARGDSSLQHAAMSILEDWPLVTGTPSIYLLTMSAMFIAGPLLAMDNFCELEKAS